MTHNSFRESFVAIKTFCVLLILLNILQIRLSLILILFFLEQLQWLSFPLVSWLLLFLG